MTGEVAIEVFEAIEQIADQIKVQERECLERVWCRFCLKKAILADISKVTKMDFDAHPNKSEYWYKMGMKDQYLLMTAELFADVVDGKTNFRLQVDFNKELTKDNEL